MYKPRDNPYEDKAPGWRYLALETEIFSERPRCMYDFVDMQGSKDDCEKKSSEECKRCASHIEEVTLMNLLCKVVAKTKEIVND